MIQDHRNFLGDYLLIACCGLFTLWGGFPSLLGYMFGVVIGDIIYYCIFDKKKGKEDERQNDM